MTSDVREPPMLVLPDLIESQLRDQPDGQAARDKAQALTYRELAARSDEMASQLYSLGVRRGDRVVLALGNSIDMVASIFATAKLRAVFIPFRDDAPDAALSRVLADCEPRLVLTRGQVGDGQPRGALAQVVSIERLRDESKRPDVSRDWGRERPMPTDLACLIYTSGSTGRPKGVMCPHGCMMFAIDAIARRLALRSDDTIASVLPLTFDYGLYQVFLALRVGATVVLGEGAAAGAGMLGFLRTAAPTVVPVVPSMARLLVRLAARSDAVFLAVRSVTSTGEALPESLAQSLTATFPHAGLFPMYGLTECKRVSILQPDEREGHPTSVGRPLDGTECIIVDPVTQDELSAGEVGELVVRGPHVMAGYWRDPMLTALRYRPRGMTQETVLFTGDLCSCNSEGYLFFHGRPDDIVKSNGMRVSLGEISGAIGSLAGVDDAVAFVDLADDVRVAVVTERNVPELVAELREVLEDFKVPAFFEVVDELPLTTHGKIDRLGLRQLVSERA